MSLIRLVPKVPYVPCVPYKNENQILKKKNKKHPTSLPHQKVAFVHFSKNIFIFFTTENREKEREQ
jgi:hypothetical protein